MEGIQKGEKPCKAHNEALHWLTNAAVNIKLAGNDAFQETVSIWIVYAIILIPIVAYSIFLIWKLPESYPYEMEEAG